MMATKTNLKAARLARLGVPAGKPAAPTSLYCRFCTESPSTVLCAYLQAAAWFARLDVAVLDAAAALQM